MSCAGSDTARSTPLRSVIVPRCAGSVSVLSCWVCGGLAQRRGAHRPQIQRSCGRQHEQQEEQPEYDPDPVLDGGHLLPLRARRRAAGFAARHRCRGSRAAPLSLCAGAVDVAPRRPGSVDATWTGMAVSRRFVRLDRAVAEAVEADDGARWMPLRIQFRSSRGRFRRSGRGAARGRAYGARGLSAADTARARSSLSDPRRQEPQRTRGDQLHAHVRGLQLDACRPRRLPSFRRSAPSFRAAAQPRARARARYPRSASAARAASSRSRSARTRRSRSTRVRGSAGRAADASRRQRLRQLGHLRACWCGRAGRTGRAAGPDTRRGLRTGASGARRGWTAGAAVPAAAGGSGGSASCGDHSHSACERRAAARRPSAGCSRPPPPRARSSGGVKQRRLRLAPACAHGQVGRADAALRALGQEALDAAILQRLKADPRQHAALAQQPPGERQRPVELLQLVVDGDPQRLEGALGRMAAGEPRGRGNRRVDRLDQLLGRLSIGPSCVHAGARSRGRSRSRGAPRRSRAASAPGGARPMSATISRAVSSWSGSMRMSSGAS